MPDNNESNTNTTASESKDIEIRKGSKLTILTNDTGGIGIDPRELFTTEQGRRFLERALGRPLRPRPTGRGE